MAKDWPLAWKRATAIRPEELLDVLKQLALNTPVPTGSPTTVAEAAARLLAGLGKSGADAVDSAAIAGAIEELRKQLPSMAVQKGAAVIKEFETAANVTLHNLEKWFNASQDRAKQWFAMHTRIVTVIASVVVAFGLQLDFLNLLTRLSSNSDLRAQLVAGSPGLLKQAQEVLTVTNGTDAAMAAAGQLTFATATNLVQQLGTLNAQLNNSGMSLIAQPYPRGQAWLWPWQHLLGLFLSAAFLSLGAPFWFNTLKSLTNLRPVLAQQVDKQPASTANKP